MIHFNKCPLCTSSEINQFIRTSDHFLSREVFELFKCTDCGFVFTQDHPESVNMGRYYASDDYISHNDSASGFSNRLYRISRNFMLKKKKRVVENFSSTCEGNLLDIGSGTGHFLSVMKRAGWNVKGTEINKKARDYSVSSFGLDIISPDQLPSLPSESFDCITLWHVLEHLEDPIKYGSVISNLLKTGGSCIIALPNCQSYDAEYYNDFWAAFDLPRHLWHFTPSTFRLFAEKTGFIIKDIRPLPLDVFYISFLSEKYRGTNLPFISGMFKGLWFAFLAFFKKEKSSSLIYILRKNI